MQKMTLLAMLCGAFMACPALASTAYNVGGHTVTLGNDCELQLVDGEPVSLNAAMSQHADYIDAKGNTVEIFFPDARHCEIFLGESSAVVKRINGRMTDG